ncbi:ribonuclease HII [Methanothermococcus thermolithotrophicus]|uniref:ribonuclease HII n=1 Tax=Methanothermococcus thermolithotrophicus TaxID=2186 RepID=UPI0006ACE525
MNMDNNKNNGPNNTGKIILGLDEAGRGPVLGPMVLAVVKVDEKDLEKLQKLPLKDSKQLSKSKREELFNIIKENFEVDTVVLHPERIDELMKIMNLNKIELSAFSKLTNKFLKESSGDVDIYIDACSSNEKSFSNQLRAKLINKSQVNRKSVIKQQAEDSSKKFFREVRIIAEHKADENYKIVSAASVIAKVTRDRIIDEYKNKYGEIGSGYPSDTRTINFLNEYLKKNGELPEIARKSWATSKRLLKDSKHLDKKPNENLLKWVKS